MKRFVLILRDIAFVIFVVIICGMIFMMANGKHLSIAGYQVLRVLTSSMEPAIPENTCIIIKKCPVEDLKVGDIITFTSDDPLIQGYYNTHRIHDIVQEGGETLYVTKGDAISSIDAYPVHQDQVAGIFVRELPGGRLIGKCFVALSDNRIYFLVIILPLMMCLMSYFWQIMGMVKKYDDEDLARDEEEYEEYDEKNALEDKNEAASVESRLASQTGEDASVTEQSEENTREDEKEDTDVTIQNIDEKESEISLEEETKKFSEADESVEKKEINEETEESVENHLSNEMNSDVNEQDEGDEAKMRQDDKNQLQIEDLDKDEDYELAYPDDTDDYKYTSEDLQDDDYKYSDEELGR